MSREVAQYGYMAVVPLVTESVYNRKAYSIKEPLKLIVVCSLVQNRQKATYHHILPRCREPGNQSHDTILPTFLTKLSRVTSILMKCTKICASDSKGSPPASPLRTRWYGHYFLGKRILQNLG